MDKIISKRDFLLQCRPNVRGVVGNTKLIGGHIGQNSNHDRVFNFIITKGTCTYNEATDEFKSKLQMC